MSKTPNEKMKHNIVAKKGREKINNLIGFLKFLVPELNTPTFRECSKVVILEKTVEYLKLNRIQLQRLEKNCEVIFFSEFNSSFPLQSGAEEILCIFCT